MRLVNLFIYSLGYRGLYAVCPITLIIDAVLAYLGCVGKLGAKMLQSLLLHDQFSTWRRLSKPWLPLDGSPVLLIMVK